MPFAEQAIRITHLSDTSSKNKALPIETNELLGSAVPLIRKQE